jgi:hypothetical protein
VISKHRPSFARKHFPYTGLHPLPGLLEQRIETTLRVASILMAWASTASLVVTANTPVLL